MTPALVRQIRALIDSISAVNEGAQFYRATTPQQIQIAQLVKQIHAELDAELERRR